MKSKTNSSMQKKNSFFEFLTAFVIMIVVFYIFMKRESSKLSDRVLSVDASVRVTHDRIASVRDSVTVMFPYIKRIDENNLQFNINQEEQINLLRENKVALEENNQLMSEQKELLKKIEKKQNTVIKSMNEKKDLDSFFIQRLGNTKN